MKLNRIKYKLQVIIEQAVSKWVTNKLKYLKYKMRQAQYLIKMLNIGPYYFKLIKIVGNVKPKICNIGYTSIIGAAYHSYF